MTAKATGICDDSLSVRWKALTTEEAEESLEAAAAAAPARRSSSSMGKMAEGSRFMAADAAAGRLERRWTRGTRVTDEGGGRGGRGGEHPRSALLLHPGRGSSLAPRSSMRGEASGANDLPNRRVLAANLAAEGEGGEGMGRSLVDEAFLWNFFFRASPPPRPDTLSHTLVTLPTYPASVPPPPFLVDCRPTPHGTRSSISHITLNNTQLTA